MIEIKDLLTRFEKLISSGEGYKKDIQTAIFECTGLEIPTQKISVKNGSAYLDIKPIYKNEIALNEESIKNTLTQKLGQKPLRDFR